MVSLSLIIKNCLNVKVKSLIPRSEARRIVLERRMEISEIELKRKTKKIIDRFASLNEFMSAKTVHCYVSSRVGEVDTHPLINLMESWGKSIVIPKLNPATGSFLRGYFSGWNNLEKNRDGYLEPKIGINDDLDDIDLFIVPAVALTSHCRRIGYGHGYYQKLLKSSFAPKIALAFEFQIFDNIELTPDDFMVDKIVTELRVISAHQSL